MCGGGAQLYNHPPPLPPSSSQHSHITPPPRAPRTTPVRQRARGIDTSLSKKALQDTEKDHEALAAAAEDPYAGQYYLVEDTERLAAGQSRLGAKPPVHFSCAVWY